ncbi:MAG: urea transporter [Planctomycetota bacterium]|nr:urea transporter [Planctomycetota bacterium]
MIASVFRCYSEVFLINGSATTGFLIFAATMLNWQLGTSGIIAVVAAYVFSRLIRLDHEFFQPGFYTYNPLLIGLLIGSMVQFSWLTVFFVVVASVFTLLLTIGMVHFFRVHLGLPVLSLPYAVGSVIVYLASLRYSNLLVSPSEIAAPLRISFDMPMLLAGFLKSLGAVFLLPYEITGLAFSMLLLLRSRILFLLAFAGYATGVLTRSAMLGSLAQSILDPGNFNFILIAIAIGGVFLIPSPSSYVIAIVAVIGSTILLDAVQVYGSLYGIPVYTLPFNIVALGGVYSLSLTAYPGMAKFIGVTPEDTVEHAAVAKRRYPGEYRSLHLPFFGVWTVWQQPDDDWTHQGAWKHAYDFVITDDESHTFQGSGLHLDDYYCYRKPVVSPVRGRISTVVSNVADNAIGRVDRTNNWGNYILIYDERGYYVELSHFAQDSITVKPGEWVEPGAVLGLCGNSGHSPQPHLHVHVQYFHAVGAATLPFSFLNYVDAQDTHHANANPTVGMRIKSAPATDSQLAATTDFLIGDVVTYDIHRAGSKVGEFHARACTTSNPSSSCPRPLNLGWDTCCRCWRRGNTPKWNWRPDKF